MTEPVASESPPTQKRAVSQSPEDQSPASPRPRSVRVNGEPHALPSGGNVQALVEELGLAGRKIAVAVDRVVVPRSRLAEHRLVGGEQIEILEAVGGG